MSDYILNKNQYDLLMIIINNNKCFDKRDNTFLLSNRKLADKVKCSASKVDQLFRVLNKHSLIKKLRTTYYTKDNRLSTSVRMLNPHFMYWNYDKTNRWYCSALYELESLDKTDQWRRVCREINAYINPVTGELDDGFNWYYIDKKAEEYTCFDRCYRKGDKFLHPKNTQGYRINELSMNPLTEQDQRWIDIVNSESEYAEEYKQRKLSKVYRSAEEYQCKDIYQIKV